MGKDAIWYNIQLWEENFPDNIKSIHKGDYIELKGHNKIYKNESGEKKTEFVDEGLGNFSSAQKINGRR